MTSVIKSQAYCALGHSSHAPLLPPPSPVRNPASHDAHAIESGSLFAAQKPSVVSMPPPVHVLASTHSNTSQPTNASMRSCTSWVHGPAAPAAADPEPAAESESVPVVFHAFVFHVADGDASVPLELATETDCNTR